MKREAATAEDEATALTTCLCSLKLLEYSKLGIRLLPGGRERLLSVATEHFVTSFHFRP